MSGEHVSSLSSGPAELDLGDPGGDAGPAAGVRPGAGADQVSAGAAAGASTQRRRADSRPVDLRLVALTPDGGHLVLEDSASRQFRVPVDERLAAALRSTTRHRARPGQLEIALESQLSPREIQARIRAGRSVDEVALAAGISTERVERYASPVMAERTHVLEQAQRTPGRRASGGSAPALQDLVDRRLTEQQVSSEAAEWDAWRGDDEERWTVRLSYLAGGRSRTATWTFDPRGRVLSPADDEARWLVDDPGTERLSDVPPAAIRRLASVPGPDAGPEHAPGPAAAVSRADEVYDREADEAAAAAAGAGGDARSGAAGGNPRGGTAGPAGDAGPAHRHAGRSGRRPAVPSWDDIMFGTRKRD